MSIYCLTSNAIYVHHYCSDRNANLDLNRLIESITCWLILPHSINPIKCHVTVFVDLVSNFIPSVWIPVSGEGTSQGRFCSIWLPSLESKHPPTCLPCVATHEGEERILMVEGSNPNTPLWPRIPVDGRPLGGPSWVNRLVHLGWSQPSTSVGSSQRVLWTWCLMLVFGYSVHETLALLHCPCMTL
ncbi:uncharacterized protein LOC143249650 isoform X1 [Tachypleus tridentatus]|uniref:uncharacterized protein LOC143249650 isoform X1 n=1 Tax=Tachypleus tridentatus TaxID=6853 RepID=UPI003FCF4695